MAEIVKNFVRISEISKHVIIAVSVLIIPQGGLITAPIIKPNPYIETRILHKLLIIHHILVVHPYGAYVQKSLLAILSTEKEKIAAEPMGATNIFCLSCETNILHIISRFYVGI